MIFPVAADVDDNLSCLSIPGTRKTVYLSGSELAEEEPTNISVNVCKKKSIIPIFF